MKKMIIVILLLLVTGFYTFSQDEENDIDSLGLVFIEKLLGDKDYEAVMSLFDESIKSSLTAERLEQATESFVNILGSYKSILEISENDFIDSSNNTINKYYYLDFEKNKIDMKIVFTNDNKILSFFVIPHNETWYVKKN